MKSDIKRSKKNPATNRPSPFVCGVRDGIPIGLGYFTVAFSLGIIARKAGLTAVEGFIGSLLTRASAGEYGVYTQIATEAAFAEVALMCIVTNLRYLLMGASLTQKFHPDTPQWKRVLLACCITDEVYGISIAYRGWLAPSYTYGAMLISGLMWASGTASGIIAGSTLPVNIVSALSVALYGMFLAIIVPPAKRDRALLIAVIVSFLASWLLQITPVIREMDAGMRTIILTVVISAAAAWIRPVRTEKGAFGPKGLNYTDNGKA